MPRVFGAAPPTPAGRSIHMLDFVSRGSEQRRKLKGFVYRLTDDRILERLETDDTFTDVFSYGEAGDRQLALLCLEDGVVSAIAVMVRGQAVASYKRVARFSSVILLEPPVEIKALLAAMPHALASSVGPIFDAGGKVEPKHFAGVLDALKRVQPDNAGAIDNLAGLLGPTRRETTSYQEVIGFERDAAGVALDLAGLKRLRPEVLRSWRPPSAPAPFLEGLTKRRFNEEQIIAHDMRVFGDWALKDEGDPLAVSFSDGNRQVTLASVHRTDVETSTGADLIYYSHDWDAYVLVQYKRMEHETGEGWYLRPSRAGHLPKELARLKELPRGAADAAADADSFRLSDEAAYLKLCRRLHLDGSAGRLAEGIYLPVSFYELVIAEARGPRGGQKLTMSGLRERWLTNDAFVELVGSGLIGSRTTGTAAITKQIRAALDEDRSVTLAVGGATRWAS
jgi:hypothetical protein